MTRIRRTRKRVLLLSVMAAAFISLLFLGVGEITARLFLRGMFDTELLASQMASVSIKSLITLDDDPEVMYVLRHNLDTTFHESRVFTNSTGQRIGLQQEDSPAGATRVALIGDSTAFGWRVEFEESYGELVRRALESRTGKPVVFRNFSVPGYNAAQEHSVFLRDIKPFDPHLLIVHHDHNDSEATGEGFSTWLPPEYGDNFLGSAAIKILIRQVKNFSNKLSETTQGTDNEFLDGYCWRGPLYDDMLGSRRMLMDSAREAGIPALALIFHANVVADPDYETSPIYERLHKGLAVGLSEMGYAVLDMFPKYQAMLKESGNSNMEDLWIGDPDLHPNPKRHAFIADTLMEFIEQDASLQKLLR